MIHGLPWTAFVVLVICQCHVAPMLVIINGLNGSLLDKYLYLYIDVRINTFES